MFGVFEEENLGGAWTWVRLNDEHTQQAQAEAIDRPQHSLPSSLLLLIPLLPPISLQLSSLSPPLYQLYRVVGTGKRVEER
jgi:hypothetical protein